MMPAATHPSDFYRLFSVSAISSFIRARSFAAGALA